MTLTKTSIAISLLKNLQFTDRSNQKHASTHLKGCMSKLVSLPVFQILVTDTTIPPSHPAWNLGSYLWLLLPPSSQIQIVMESVNYFSYSFSSPPPSSFPSYSMSMLIKAPIISCLNYAWAYKLVSLPLVPRNFPLWPLPTFHLTHQSCRNDSYFPMFSHLHILMTLAVNTLSSPSSSIKFSLIL